MESNLPPAIIDITRRLAADVDALSFSDPVTHVHNPIRYAWRPVESYLQKYGEKQGRSLLIGMNPGPWGMAQTGVPFGEVNAVRDFLGISEPVDRPRGEHPKRPVMGFECSRSEVSGRRLWGWAADRFGTADAFFQEFFVWNYCPLCFMEESGRNRTPDKLPAAERKALFQVCDAALREMVDALAPSRIIGIGVFASKRTAAALERGDINTVLHPSPASPGANRGWAEQAERQLAEMGVTLPQAAAPMT